MATRRTTKRSERARTAEPILHVDAPEVDLEERKARNPDQETDETETDEESAEETSESLPAPLDDMPAGDVDEESEDAHAPDDALGLYLRQMGAIPLLNRDQELALAERLEMRRQPLSPRRPVELADAGPRVWRRSSAFRRGNWPSTRPSTWSPRWA